MSNREWTLLPNLFENLPSQLIDEQFDTLVDSASTRIVRIISTGQSTPPDEWYDQGDDEWVLVLRGKATLRFEGPADDVILGVGDSISIPAHCRHRVESTDVDQPTVWLAVHYQ